MFPRAQLRMVVACLALALLPRLVWAEQVVIYAAASLRGALEEIMAGPDAPVVSYAGSSTLARQIALGAPADLFISANGAWMDWLDEASRIEPGSRRIMAGNSLVVIGPTGHAPLPIEDLPAALGNGRLAMGLVQAVPAGIYGREALEALGLWTDLAPHIAQSDNVRAALALVATGATPYGIVYASDALADPRVSVVAEIPSDLHGPITYPVAIIAGRDTAASRAVLDRLTSPAAQQILRRHGFTDPEGRP